VSPVNRMMKIHCFQFMPVSRRFRNRIQADSIPLLFQKTEEIYCSYLEAELTLAVGNSFTLWQIKQEVRRRAYYTYFHSNVSVHMVRLERTLW
jgi:hypothetical protein